jgi:hypothetical protein
VVFGEVRDVGEPEDPDAFPTPPIYYPPDENVPPDAVVAPPIYIPVFPAHPIEIPVDGHPEHPIVLPEPPPGYPAQPIYIPWYPGYNPPPGGASPDPQR